jgi:carboxyl-terminal processing protease
MRTSHIVGLKGLILLGLAACGGGEDGGFSGGGGGITYTPGVFRPFAEFADQCETPRTGFDPFTSQRYPDVKGSALAEKYFLRSWTDSLYLWYSEVADRDPASVAGVADYFNLLKTTVTLSSGTAKDQFHFTYDTAAYQQLSSSGTQLGYGISWTIIDPAASTSLGRQMYVQYVQPGSAAATNGVVRGMRLMSIDGIDVLFVANVTALNAALFDPAVNSTHVMVFADRNNPGTTVTKTLPAANVAFDAVPIVSTQQTAAGKVGYLLFNDHTRAAEAALVGAIQQLKTENVTELVLDLRYNGGGYLDIASSLAYMIAGPARTSGKTFELVQFNSKHPTVNPVTGQAIAPVPFHSTGQGFSVPASTALPSLNLARVYVLTSADTCSASEAVINGLRGVGVTVYQIGGTTCGKPYGFYARDNCGTTYFSIQFRGINEAGFGDYAEGFSATRSSGEPQANLPGCAAHDDLKHDLGDPAEGQLAVGLGYLVTGVCPVQPSAGRVRAQSASADLSPAEQSRVLRVPREPWRSNRILQ